MVPVPRPLPAGRRDLGAEASRYVSPPRWLDVAWRATQANVLEATVRPAADGQAGSVDLTGRPWNEVPAPPLADGATGDAPLWRSDSNTPVEIPLWKRLTYLLQPPAELLLAHDGPVEWPGTLFPYQLEGVHALLSRETLLLADDMGLGKTIQAAVALRILALQRQVESCLLIAPAGLLGQWRNALRQWAPELRLSVVHGPAEERVWQWHASAHLYLTSYETFREDMTANPQSPPRRRVWDAVILDEAQRIKNRETEVSRKCKQLRRRRAWALSGTPLENSIEDLASVLEFVTPLRDGGPAAPPTSSSRLLEKLRTFQLRRRKADVLPQLPPKIVSQIVLPLTGAQRESYDRAERDGILQLRERGEQVHVDNVLDLIIRLKQICNVCPATGQSAKLDDLQQRLHTLALEGHRALVFTQFVDQRYGARALAARLQTFQPLLFTGDLSLSQREAVIQRFKDDRRHKALILSLRAGGTGLNLQEASYVFHFDRWWNPAVERQAEDRSHRLGQTYPVHVYTYTCEGTVEERIDEILRAKQYTFDALIDEVSLDIRSLLTQTELFSLFGLVPPARSSG
jgi:SNF2 family DNA or RNA helicase